MKTSSVAFVGLFFTLSGIAVFLIHVIFDLNTHPSSCKAKVTRQGSPIKSLSLSPQQSGTLQLRFWISFLVLPTTAFGPQLPVPPYLVCRLLLEKKNNTLLYLNPMPPAG